MLLCLKLVWQLVNFLVSGCCNVVQLQATIVQIVPLLKGKYQLSSCKFIDSKDIRIAITVREG